MNRCVEQKPYNANGEQTVVTVTSSTSGAVDDIKLIRGGKEKEFNLQGKTLDGKQALVKAVKEVCEEVGLPPEFDWTWVLAFAGQESGWEQRPRGEGTYMGLFQISYVIFNKYKKKFDFMNPVGDIHDVKQNTYCAVRYLNDNYENYVSKTELKGVDRVLACFICHNAGQGAFNEFYKAAKEKTFKGILNAIMQIKDWKYYNLDKSSGGLLKREEIHNFPLESNGFHNYVLDWLKKNKI